MRISVVIPCYNHERYVAEAIRSVARQDHPDIEIIVVDDGSTDGSAAIARRELEAAPVTRTAFIEQENAGAHVAIMNGIAASTGKCLTLLNSDDAFLPERLSRVAGLVHDRERYLMFTRVRLVDDESRVLPPESPHARWYHLALTEAANAPTVGFGLLLHNFSITSGNLVFSRKLYEDLGGFSAHKFCHDWDFLMRATHHVEPDFLDQELMSYRVHAENTTHALRGVQESEARDALNRFLDLCEREAPQNPKAPCPCNWKRFFKLFAEKHAFHFGTEKIAFYIDGWPDRPVASDHTGGSDDWAQPGGGTLSARSAD